jgi:hypothetical protein
MRPKNLDGSADQLGFLLAHALVAPAWIDLGKPGD